MEHRFDGPRYPVGIEEELMILAAGSLDLANAIDEIVGEEPAAGQIKPELLESVLEIATTPCANISEAGAGVRALRTLAAEGAAAHELRIGASGTQPFARWEDQRVVSDDRYRSLIRSLGFVARQEVVFGMHVHVGMGGAEETIHVANNLRPYVPLLIGLAANSPLWRGRPPRGRARRAPAFPALPPAGRPPAPPPAGRLPAPRRGA